MTWAAHALGNLSTKEDNQVSIAQAGGILPPLVKSVKCGTDEHMKALHVLFGTWRTTKTAGSELHRKEEYHYLSAKLVESGTEQQIEYAAGVLFNLAFNDDNKAIISQAEAIPSLIKLVRVGTDKQMENAAALWSLARNSIGNQGDIALEGGVMLLLQNATTSDQKGLPAGGLAMLCVSEATIVLAGGIPALVQLEQNSCYSSRDEDMFVEALGILGFDNTGKDIANIKAEEVRKRTEEEATKGSWADRKMNILRMSTKTKKRPISDEVMDCWQHVLCTVEGNGSESGKELPRPKLGTTGSQEALCIPCRPFSSKNGAGLCYFCNSSGNHCGTSQKRSEQMDSNNLVPAQLDLEFLKPHFC